ncbi:MAG TPA: peptide ABC transporter substrate-binding protein [Ktedonobacteraceae bacterium]|nr:peptide ABC transporter substrate-binding protein [Ktedonobacteraceae bacterium]
MATEDSRGILLLPLLFFLLLACNAPPAPQVQSSSSPLLGPYTSTPPTAQGPRGTLVFADRQFPDTVNPLFAGSSVDLEVETALWGAPVVFDDHFHAQPDELSEVPLPENGDVRDGGLTIIMHLRHDLHWSDGQPILARDFQYWWQLDQNPTTGALSTTGYDQIASIETPDDYTVILHMKHPYGPYLSYLPLAAPYHAWSNLRPIDLQNDRQVLLTPTVTSGPYKLAGFVDGQSYSFTPNTLYRSTTFHGPWLAHLTFRAYSSASTLLAAIQAHQVDIIEGLMEDELPTFAHLPTGYRLLTAPAASYEHLDFNMSNPLFQDVRVRRAIQLAINTCAILRDVLRMSDCSRAASQVEPPPSLYYDPALQPVAFDPGLATRLLAQAGWNPGTDGLLTRHGQIFTIRLVTTAGNPLRAATARLIQQALRAIGIQATISSHDLQSFFAIYTRGGILATGNFDLAMFGYQNSPEPDDEYGVFHSSQIPTANLPTLGNYGRISDPIIDSSLSAGRATVTFIQRLQDYHTFLERLAAQVYIIPLYTDLNAVILSNHAQNFLPNPNVLANNWNISDWWTG